MDVTSYLLGKKSGGGSKPPVLQDKEVTITENGTTNVTADEGYDGLNEVEVTTNVSGGGDLSEYFNDAGNGWGDLIKKIPGPVNIYGVNPSYAFDSCPLNSFPKINVQPNITNLEYFFNNCFNVTEININNFNTSYVSSMQRMFNSCQNLQTINMSNCDMGAVSNVYNMFYSSSKLENLSFGYDLGKGYLTTESANYYAYTLDVHYSTRLSHDSLMSIINGLYDIASARVQPQKLVLGATNLAKLSQAEIDIATNKGWTVS